jgi:FtsH-binding integral membrane protein
MANPNLGTFNRAGTVADQASFDVGLRAHMVRVYNYMASGLALSGIVAIGLFSSAELASLFFQVQAGLVVGLNVLGWVAIFAPLGLLLLTSFRAGKMSVGAVQAVYWAVTALMIFSGLIAYDTQKIKEQYAEAWGSEVAQKVAIFSALSLYLDFVNLFQFLMMFLGQRR